MSSRHFTQIVLLSILILPCVFGVDCTGPQGLAGLDGQNGQDGQDGQNGQDGADGQLRIYGDGSAGARTVTSNENWTTAGDAPTNLQFTDVTIDAGVTLTLPSGMTIRCSGTFTNNGTIIVQTGAEGGFASQIGTGGDFSSVVVPPDAGIGTRAAQAAEAGDNTAERFGGHGAIGLGEFEARQILDPGVSAGGGGAPGGSDLVSGVTGNFGAAGGGSLRVLALGAVVNASGAAIEAVGQDAGNSPGGGGGGGGVVILASQASITNAGTVSVIGGDGEDGDSNETGSGGGGGGIIHLLAPDITNTGTTDATGGSGGLATNIASAVDRFGGGGGGSCGGSGGDGGDLPPGVNGTGGTNGADGFVFVTEVDPTALF